MIHNPIVFQRGHAFLLVALLIALHAWLCHKSLVCFTHFIVIRHFYHIIQCIIEKSIFSYLNNSVVIFRYYILCSLKKGILVIVLDDLIMYYPPTVTLQGSNKC